METKKVKELANNILECVKAIENLEEERKGALKSFKHWKGKENDYFHNLELASKNIIKTGGKIYFQQLQIKQLIKQLNKEWKN